MTKQIALTTFNLLSIGGIVITPKTCEIQDLKHFQDFHVTHLNNRPLAKNIQG